MVKSIVVSFRTAKLDDIVGHMTCNWALFGKTAKRKAMLRIAGDTLFQVGRGMRSNHVHCACDMNRAHEDDNIEKLHQTMEAAKRELRLSHTLKSVCVCVTCEVRCTVYTLRRLQGNRHFL